MSNNTKRSIAALCGSLLILSLSPAALADDHDEVMDVVMRYANLEHDLAEQAKLIRSDRVMITGLRMTDQAKNMQMQMAARAANERANGGADWIVEIESPEVRVYGDTAVVSLMRRFHIYPESDAAPINTPPHWLTLVLVKERGDWGIAHTHLSPLWQPPN